jgi:hypothetical protein
MYQRTITSPLRTSSESRSGTGMGSISRSMRAPRSGLTFQGGTSTGRTLPLNMFYNTGIATYIWVLGNRKPARRKGRLQLIDATQWFKPLRKNLGKKNCELSDEDIQRICDTFLAFEETEQSKIFRTPRSATGR